MARFAVGGVSSERFILYLRGGSALVEDDGTRVEPVVGGALEADDDETGPSAGRGVTWTGSMDPSAARFCPLGLGCHTACVSVHGAFRK
jgi:hypothetical protein